MLQGSRIIRSARVGSDKHKKVASTGHHTGIVEETHEESRLVDTFFNLIPTFFPYKRPYGHIFQHKNSNCILTILANHKFGLPYGMLPRLIFVSIINEVHETKSPALDVATLYSKLLCNIKNLQYPDKHDNEKYLYDQILRFFSSFISCDCQHPNVDKSSSYVSFDFWRTPLKGNKESILFNSIIVLTKDFYNKLIKIRDLIDLQMVLGIHNDGLVLKSYQLKMESNDIRDKRLV